MVSQVPLGRLLNQTSASNEAARALPGGREAFLNALNGRPGAVAETQTLLAELGEVHRTLATLTRDIMEGAVEALHIPPLLKVVGNFNSAVSKIREGDTAVREFGTTRSNVSPKDAEQVRVAALTPGTPRTVLAAGGVVYRPVATNKGHTSAKA